MLGTMSYVQIAWDRIFSYFGTLSWKDLIKKLYKKSDKKYHLGLSVCLSVARISQNVLDMHASWWKGWWKHFIHIRVGLVS